MEISNQDKLKLIHFLNFVCDYEASKPLEEMNEELIDSCVDVLLELQDKHVNHSPEFIDEQVRKIFHKEETETTEPESVKPVKKQINKKKVWLVAACIAILVALFSIVSFSSERSVKDVLEDFIGTFEFIPFGKEVTLGEETYKKEGIGKQYKSIEDLIENEEIDVLFPENMINNITKITTYTINNTDEINIICDNDLFITINLNTKIPQEIKDICNKKLTLNGVTCYLCVMEDVNQTQVYFIHNNNLYRITHTDYEFLLGILDKIKELKYEN